MRAYDAMEHPLTSVTPDVDGDANAFLADLERQIVEVLASMGPATGNRLADIAPGSCVQFARGASDASVWQIPDRAIVRGCRHGARGSPSIRYVTMDWIFAVLPCPPYDTT